MIMQFIESDFDGGTGEDPKILMKCLVFLNFLLVRQYKDKLEHMQKDRDGKLVDFLVVFKPVGCKRVFKTKTKGYCWKLMQSQC